MIPNPGADDDESGDWLLVGAGWGTLSPVEPVLLLPAEVVLVRLLEPDDTAVDGGECGEGDEEDADEDGGEVEEISCTE